MRRSGGKAVCLASTVMDQAVGCLLLVPKSRPLADDLASLSI